MTCFSLSQRTIRQCVARTVLGLLLLGGSARAQEITFTGTELLGRPTAESITVGVIVDQPVELYIEYGVQPGVYLGTSATSTFAAGPIQVMLDGLSPDTQYYYRLRYRVPSSTDDPFAGEEHTFHTQRSPSSTFTFTIQTDSHQGYFGFYNANLYATTLANVLADQPDFHLDLGDAFSTDDATETEATVRTKYLNQRAYFSQVGHSVPLFLVLGNHENEEGWNLDDFGTQLEKSLPVLGANARKRYFVNPMPSDFYTGNEDNEIQQIDGDHLRGDYYAFEWGAALFVAIDPFWYTMTKPFAGSMGGEKDDEVVGNRWDWTLGERQYQWLKRTLEQSTATFKFVFAHQSTGGTSDYVRAGALGAKYCEWGGFNIDGTTWGFDSERPNWELPIHALMVENDVTAFFHGHDHVFAYEQLDGIVYQECPFAAASDYGTGFPSNASDYKGGVMVNDSGHVRVTVSPTDVKVDYVRAYLPGAGTNGTIGYSYTISPRPHDSRPQAKDDAVDTNEDTSTTIDVLANDSDPNPEDVLSVIGFTQPSHGRVTQNATRFVYQPNRDYCDETTPDRFRYVASDGRGGIDRAYVNVTVHCVDDPPIAVDDAASGNPDELLTVNVIANDNDVDHNLVPSSISILRDPSNGSAMGNVDGTISYQSRVAFTGSDSLDYQICDDAGLCDTATVRITIKCAGAEQCDDGNVCSTDACDVGGTCTHVTQNCNDNNACTVDACDASTGCTHATLDCTDGNACTVDACDASTGCTHSALNCNDGNACTVDACDASTGCTHAALNCNDDNLCTVDTCSPSTGCTYTALNCNDDNACTVDACSPSTGCTHAALNCYDDNACTVDACDPSTGCTHAALNCDDADPCTVDSCSPKGCVHVPMSCDDGNACTIDSCVAGTCAHREVDCGSDMCRQMTCNPSNGQCQGHGVDCDDGNPCTIDTCEATIGCVHKNGDAACDDGKSCTTNDHCIEGKCQGALVDCSAVGNECAKGICNENARPACIAQALTDGTPCSQGKCQQGQCVPVVVQGSGGAGGSTVGGGTGTGGTASSAGGSLAQAGQGTVGGASAATGGTRQSTAVGGASAATGGTQQSSAGSNSASTGGTAQNTGTGGTTEISSSSKPVQTESGGGSGEGNAGNTSTTVSSGGNQGTVAGTAGLSSVTTTAGATGIRTNAEHVGWSLGGSGCACSTTRGHSASVYFGLLAAGIAVGLRRRKRKFETRRPDRAA